MRITVKDLTGRKWWSSNIDRIKDCSWNHWLEWPGFCLPSLAIWHESWNWSPLRKEYHSAWLFTLEFCYHLCKKLLANENKICWPQEKLYPNPGPLAGFKSKFIFLSGSKRASAPILKGETALVLLQCFLSLFLFGSKAMVFCPFPCSKAHTWYV